MDRQLQLEILKALDEVHPERIAWDNLPGSNRADFRSTMRYLWEHEVLDGEVLRTLGAPWALGWVIITAKGKDLLADDGGLTAIFGTVTIKLHPDTLRDLLLAKVTGSDLPGEEKSALEKAVRNAPATAFSGIVQGLVGLALDRVPAALELLRSSLL